METVLVNYGSILKEKLTSLEKVVAKYESKNSTVKNQMNEIKRLYAVKLNDLKPQIMVYGIYNAGKSSIINELLKSDRAKVADVPTTDSVTYYDWNGYKIADTPGVGAPIQHEEVTQQHLKQADVVIFVMSTTGSNEKAENYSRMKDIVDAGKKVIIVLNDKNGDLGKNDEGIYAIKNKVMQNMRTVGISNVESQYCIVVVNAKRAMLGRQKQQPVLIDKSNIQELERVLVAELKNTPSFAIYRNTIIEVEKSIENIINILDKGSSDEIEQEFNKLLSKIRESKKGLREDMQIFIRNQSIRMGRSLPDMIWADKNNAEAIANKQVEEVVTKVQKHLENCLLDLGDDINQDLNDFVGKVTQIKATLSGNMQVEQGYTDASQEYASDIRVDDVLKLAKNIMDVIGKNRDWKIPTTIPSQFPINTNNESGNNGGAVGTALGSAVGQQIGKAALGSILGKIGLGTVAGPIGMILGGFLGNWLFGGGNDDHGAAEAARQTEIARRQAEMEAQARQAVEQKCLYAAEDLANDLIENVNSIVREILGNIEDSFREQINNQKSDANNLSEDLMTIRKIADEYQMLRSELSSRM